MFTQSYPLPATAPSVHGTRPTDQPGADPGPHPNACVTARNASGIVRAVELEPPRTMRSRILDVFHDWGVRRKTGSGRMTRRRSRMGRGPAMAPRFTRPCKLCRPLTLSRRVTLSLPMLLNRPPTSIHGPRLSTQGILN